MAIKDMLLPEFDQEAATTRKFLERVPEDKPDWRPHPKSMALARLAGHLAELPMWAGMTLQSDSLDINPPGGPGFTPTVMKSRAELLALFDANVKGAREALAGASDADFMKPWSLLSGGEKRFTLPKVAVLRGFVFSHAVHHRAQLGVYLRMNDIPLPQTYGPSGDEGVM
jgi:uncharacterized damage-inducible protein DinB